MLNTINGFDLLLVIIIVIAGFKIYNLNRECESYVSQIIEVSQDNYRLSEQVHDLKYPAPPLDKGIYDEFCNYCLEINGFECTCIDPFNKTTVTDPHLTDPSKCDCDDCWIVPTKFNKRTDLDCQFTSQCACKDCVPF